MAEYEVKFLARGIVSVILRADDRDKAIAQATEQLLRFKSVFAAGLNEIDWNTQVVGVENLDLWRKVDK